MSYIPTKITVNYCKVVIFSFVFLAINCFSQKSISVQKQIEYQIVKWNDNSDIKFLCPENGYFDQLSFQAVFQYKLPFADYEITSFEFHERPLTYNEKKAYSNVSFADNYLTSFRKQEQNATLKNNLLIVNCIRNSNGELYLLTDFKAQIVKKTNLLKRFKNSTFASQSVLNNGANWFKLSNFESGVYKIDYNYMITNSIISSEIPSNSIHLFSNNKGLLSPVNDDSRPDDLEQQSIFVFDGGDGLFSQGDYILFYLDGPDRINFDGQNFNHTKHIYSDSAYCFLNIDNSRLPNNLDSINNLNQTFNQTITKFKDFNYKNEDKLNLLKSGSQWFGDVFDLTNIYTYSFPFNFCTDSSHIKLNLMSKSNYSTAYFYPLIFGESRIVPINSTGSSYYSDVGRVVVEEFDVLNNPNVPYELTLEYSNNGAPSSKGYLDYIEINCDRLLVIDNQEFSFNVLSSGSSDYSKVVLDNSSSVDMIWDITDFRDVKNLSFTKSNEELIFLSFSDTLRHFVAVSGSNFQSPTFVKKVSSQNLHGLNNVDMVIISPTEFLNAAEELSLLHQNEGLNVVTVSDEQIYNEFSGGLVDATAIKQFLRMFYSRENGNPLTIPKYCLLFGDGSYDNRNILGHNKNILPIFESSESVSIVNTYASDDYYAILADGASMQNTDFLNIGIGRLVVTTLLEANEMVQKIKNYSLEDANSMTSLNCNNPMTNSIYGDWRNKVVLVSDDEDNNAYFNDIEIMASKIKVNKGSINTIKIHSDAYVQQSSTVGERIPDAEAAINQKVKDGALLVNYIGHGGETGWAHEQILTVPTIQNWDNNKALPVFMTATCEFGRFDDHDRVSGGEYILLNKDGGGIGLFTTTRLVYATPNEWLNRFFYDTVFDFVNQKPQRLGDIYVGTKNKFAQFSADKNYRKFALLGDPAIRFAIPELKVEIDSFNRDTVNALSEVKIYGHLSDNFENTLTNFNGKVYLTFYDKESSLSTLGTNPGSDNLPFKMWKNVIYKGQSSASNGEFSFTFKVPKDIGYDYGFSRISLYAEDGTLDASGYNDSLIIGGIDTTASLDEKGPDLELYLNDENFVSGGISNANPLLIVTVFDENGINTVGNGIGHDIELVIDNDYANSVVLNDYYVADLDTYKSGRINFELNDIDPGEHNIKIKVWDNYNNSSLSEINFKVVEDNELELSHVLNFPNPFTTNTAFYFEHNQNCNFLDVSILIYSVSGKVVKRINKRILNEGFRSQGISWDGKDDFNEDLARGVYVYNLRVTNEQGLSADKTQTMFLLK